MNSLVNKIQHIHSFLLDYNVSIVGISETWLTSQVLDACLSIPHYVLIRKDVAGNIAKHGVCLYVKKNLNFVEIVNNVPNTLIVFLPEFSLYFVSIYRPPSYTDIENDVLLSFLLEFCLGKNVLLVGDFNLPTIRWNEDLVYQGLSPNDLKFYNCFNALGLTQWVQEPTYFSSGNILDLILSSEDDRVLDVQVVPPFPRCGHSPVVCRYVLKQPPHHDVPSLSRLWTKGNYNIINKHLSQIDWDYEFSHLDADAMYTVFLEIVHSLVEIYVPTSDRSDAGPPWPVKPPPYLKRRRSVLWAQYKAARSRTGRHSVEAREVLQRFLDVNFQFRTFAINAQRNYEKSLVDNELHDTKLFHAYIRNKKVARVGVGPLKSHDGRFISDPTDMANVFAAAFASVYSRVTPANPLPHQRFDGAIGEPIISNETLLSAVNQMESFSAMGPDAIHPYFLKACIGQLLLPLRIIYQKSFSSGQLPKVWKNSLVAPIFKKGSRSDPLMYRPVSLTSVVCKTFERVVVKCIYEYVLENDLLSNDQFGFRPGRSTEDQLLLTYNDITLALDNGKVVDLILFDFTKAFDVVNHSILLDKLIALGITGKVLLWVRDFLTGREMNVLVEGRKSVTKQVASGVPQGSVLGPLLFLLYINFINFEIVSPTKIFADDLKLYISFAAGSREEALQAMGQCQRDIGTLFQVSSSWGLALNPSKCIALRFSRQRTSPLGLGQNDCYYIDNAQIPFRECASDLGVCIDTSLKFHQHVSNIVNKAGGVLTSILKTTVNRDSSFMLPIYSSHVRPLLEYASSIWNLGYVGDTRQLESIQRRWTREISGLEGLDYTQRLQRLNLYSVKGRLLRHDLIKYWQIFHGQSSIPRDDLFPRPMLSSTRGHQFKIAHTRTQLEVRKRFFSMRCVDLWNSLPAELVGCENLAVFKRELAFQLGDLLFQYD